MGSPALSVSRRGSLLPRESSCRALGPPEAFGKLMQGAGPTRSLRKAPAERRANPKPSECPCSVQGQSEAFGNAPAERRAILKRSGSSCSVQGQSEAFGNAPAACLAHPKPSAKRPCRAQEGISHGRDGPAERRKEFPAGGTALQRAGTILRQRRSAPGCTPPSTRLL